MTDREENGVDATGGAAGGVAGWADKPGARWLIASMLALVTLAVFLPVIHHDFISYDDPAYVTANWHVQRGLSREGLLWAWGTGHSANWHPLTWISHMLDCEIFGAQAGGHHLVSAGFHAINTGLLFLVLAGMTGAPRRSAVVAGLFGLHPLHVESVAWASERKDVLSAFFFLLTLLAWLRYLRFTIYDLRAAPVLAAFIPKRDQASEIRNPAGGSSPGKLVPSCTPGDAGLGPEVQGSGFREGPQLSTFNVQRSTAYALALFFFALGLMSKPMLVTLPFVLLLLDYWPLRRVRSAECGVPNDGSPLIHPPLHHSITPSLRLLVEKAPFFALSAAASVVTWVVQREGGAFPFGLSFGARLGNAVIAYVRYIGKMFWPEQLAVFYPHPIHWPAWQVAAAAAFLAGVSVAVLVCRQRRAYLLAGWLWYLGMLVPVIGLAQVGRQSMADRYTYLPLIGLFIMLVWGMSEALGRGRRRVMAVGAALAMAVCAMLTTRQLSYWQDSEALFGHALAAVSNNFMAYYNLGLARLKQERAGEAVAYFRECLRLVPDMAEVEHDLGRALADDGQVEEALVHLGKALELMEEAQVHLGKASKLKPGFAKAHNDLGRALFTKGRMTEAIAHFQKALEANPDLAEAHNNLGDALQHHGEVDEGLTHLKKALALQPDNAIACNNLGAALRQKGQLNEAITQFRKALGLRPDLAEAHNNLANALAVKGQVEEAIVHFQAAVRLQPRNPTIRDNFARLLLLQGRLDEAVAQYRAALELQPGDGEAWATLQRVAWVLATSPEASLRNGSRAVQLGEQLNELTGKNDSLMLATLAAAYAEAGRFGEAATTAEKALVLVAGQTNAARAAALNEQLALYRAGSAFRDTSLARPASAPAVK